MPQPETTQEIPTFELYRTSAARTDGGHPIAYYVGGLCEEAGEVWGSLKKTVWHGHEFDRDKVVGELGDVLWMLDRIACRIGVTLAEVAGANERKLRHRYPDGFDKARSVARVDPDSVSSPTGGTSDSRPKTYWQEMAEAYALRVQMWRDRMAPDEHPLSAKSMYVRDVSELLAEVARLRARLIASGGVP